jgi:O-acetyl-ADP-ribose deacetylase (regulator of RNase III)
MRLRLLPRVDLAAVRNCDALATSANAGLVGNANPNFWRFAGKANADGALHRAAGPRLLDACHEVAAANGSVRCDIGEAVVTPAFGLHAENVIHAVAPDGLYAVGLQTWWGRRQWSGGQSAPAVHLQEAPPAGQANELLTSTYASILTSACTIAARSVAMPAVGCGVLGFAAGRSAKVALGALAAHSGGSLERVDVALLDDDAFSAWSRTCRALIGEPESVGAQAGIEVYDLRRSLEHEGERGWNGQRQSRQ